MTRFLRIFTVTLLVALAASPVIAAEDGNSAERHAAADVLAQQFLPNGAYPVATPESALQVFQRRSQQQRLAAVEYSDTTIIHADLPDTSQSGEYELRRRYVAPKTLEFKPVRYSGDSFVKTNIMIRLLQSEVDHVTKEDGAQTAITSDNYKFKHKFTMSGEGHTTYVYDVKPRKKRPGLFKGRIWVDASTGALRRAEGTLVKSPSFFIKRLDFVQDYEELDGMVLPTHLHSVSKVRIIGRAVVDIFHRDYTASNLTSATEVASGTR